MVFNDFFIDLDGYYIVRTDEGQPRPKYILINVELTSTFFTLQRFGPSPSPNFKILVVFAFSYFEGNPVYIHLMQNDDI